MKELLKKARLVKFYHDKDLIYNTHYAVKVSRNGLIVNNLVPIKLAKSIKEAVRYYIKHMSNKNDTVLSIGQVGYTLRSKLNLTQNVASKIIN